MSYWEMWSVIVNALILLVSFLSFLYVYKDYSKRENAKEKEKYNRLIAILYELKLLINRCEHYIESKESNEVPYNRIVMRDFYSAVSQAQIAEIDPKTYNSIKKMYTGAEIIAANYEAAEKQQVELYTVKPEQLKNAKKIVRRVPFLDGGTKKICEFHMNQISVKSIGDRYGAVIGFIQHYLQDMYRNYNAVHRELKEYARKNFYDFPRDLKQFNVDYVIEMSAKHKLLNGKLDGK